MQGIGDFIPLSLPTSREVVSWAVDNKEVTTLGFTATVITPAVIGAAKAVGIAATTHCAPFIFAAILTYQAASNAIKNLLRNRGELPEITFRGLLILTLPISLVAALGSIGFGMSPGAFLILPIATIAAAIFYEIISEVKEEYSIHKLLGEAILRGTFQSFLKEKSTDMVVKNLMKDTSIPVLLKNTMYWNSWNSKVISEGNKLLKELEEARPILDLWNRASRSIGKENKPLWIPGGKETVGESFLTWVKENETKLRTRSIYMLWKAMERHLSSPPWNWKELHPEDLGLQFHERLKEIPYFVGDNLSILDFTVLSNADNDALLFLPQEIFFLQNLEIIRLSGCGLIEIPTRALRSLPNLKILDLRNNFLSPEDIPTNCEGRPFGKNKDVKVYSEGNRNLNSFGEATRQETVGG